MISIHIGKKLQDRALDDFASKIYDQHINGKDTNITLKDLDRGSAAWVYGAVEKRLEDFDLELAADWRENQQFGDICVSCSHGGPHRRYSCHKYDCNCNEFKINREIQLAMEMGNRCDFSPVQILVKDGEFTQPFDTNYPGPRILAWTETRVYFPVFWDYGGKIDSAPRNPIHDPALLIDEIEF